MATGHNIKWDHFDILAKGKTDYHCKIKETFFIQELEPAFNVNVGSEKLIFNDSQYGFREKSSTEHAILDIINQIENNMDSKMYSCGIFIDLKKAFDTVDHLILLQKLDHYGVRGVTNNWFASYLLGRQQTTQIGAKNIS